MKIVDFKCDYLIIAGTSRAATTALFGYLTDHPQICGSNPKETRFFLDKDYPLQSQFCYEDGIDKYLDLFKCQNSDQIKFEASPDYLYSTNTARRIKDMLSNVKIVFVLREPISRFISWFKYGKLREKIPNHMTLNEYIECQLNPEKSESILAHHPAAFALEHGRYSMYLKSY